MDDLLKLFAELFTPAQQSALLIIMIGVACLTQAFKKIYFGFYPVPSRRKKVAIIWLAAVSFGALGGIAGYFVGKPPQPLWFWMFAGTAAGGAAIGVFKVLLDTKWRVIIRRIGKGS